jgi:CIC family chloride channel protein
VAYLACRRWTIYENQVKSKIESAAHQGEFFVDILQQFRVKDLMPRVQKVNMIPQEMTFREFKRYFSETKQHYFPVMDERKRLIGIFSSTDIRSVLFSEGLEHLILMKDLATTDVIVTYPSDDLNSVLQKFTVKNIDSLPVVGDDDHGVIVGMINRREVIAFYNENIQTMKEKKPA